MRGHHGISTFSVAMAVTAFVILLGILLYAGLSMGRSFGKKSVETIQTGLVASVGNMEVLGTVTAMATLTTLHGENRDRLGPADGSTTTFPLSNSPVVSESEAIYADGTILTPGRDYNINYEAGNVTFSSAPARGVTLEARYTYYTIADGTFHIGRGAGGAPINAAPGVMVVTYLDRDTLDSNITDFTLTKLGNADADDLLETGEIFGITIDTSSYGLVGGQEFTIQLKPSLGAVITVKRIVPNGVKQSMVLR